MGQVRTEIGLGPIIYIYDVAVIPLNGLKVRDVGNLNDQRHIPLMIRRCLYADGETSSTLVLLINTIKAKCNGCEGF
jgi:hypothetical protein